VLKSYDIPVRTFDTDIMGTVNLLESLRGSKKVKSIVVVTSDKSYRNKGWENPYREIDELGGRDPYSASKSCADIVVNSYRESFFKRASVGLSSVRAGNIIGGGDFAGNRLIPDLVRSLMKQEPLHIRNPDSVRP
jgi:CDP-glucose 4,6-dehydratase